MRGSAQLSTADQAAVDAYRSAIRAAESNGSSRGIEAAFSALVSMRDALLQVRNGLSVLESLPDEEFERLQRELPGAIVNRVLSGGTVPILLYVAEQIAQM